VTPADRAFPEPGRPEQHDFDRPVRVGARNKHFMSVGPSASTSTIGFLQSRLSIVALSCQPWPYRKVPAQSSPICRNWLTGTFRLVLPQQPPNIFVLLCLFLIVLAFRKVRTSAARTQRRIIPTPAGLRCWFAAGMGIGVDVLPRVSEPIFSLTPPHLPTTAGAPKVGPRTLAVLQGDAVEARIWHGGHHSSIGPLHPWAIYAVVALALALFSYRTRVCR